jgi:enoyl-CoA hydratase/carnithine racemase
MSQVLVEKKDYIGTITFNRPERMNTISGRMLAAFSESLIDLDRDDDVRVIIITGAGRGFCAGLDLQDQMDGKGFEGASDGGGVGKAATTIDLRDAPPTVLHNVEKPTICALNGGAAGYGMDLALGCDIRIAADTAKMSAAHTTKLTLSSG